MATTTVNGDHRAPSTDSASPVADTSAQKRKREDSQAHQHSISQSRMQQIQRDILEVLERHDPQPSFLKHTFSHAVANEPSPKKARLLEPFHTATTIAEKLRNTSYASLQQMKADAAAVSENLVESVRRRALKEGARPPVEDLKYIRRIQEFESLVKDIVEKESENAGANQLKNVKESELEDGELANGHAAQRDGLPKPGTVLTLFGNAPTPKQLFSSMQQVNHAGPTIKSELPVEEMSLPNGITATKIIPVPIEEKKGPTLEDAFAPPYNLPALQPPKAHKRTSTRDKDATWEFNDPVQRNRKGGYTVQPLSVGDWLNYGGTDGVEANTSREKQKERTRALSISGETAERLDKSTLQEALIKEEEALFRRAFSSFAPTCDNANSVIPAKTKNLAWWNKVGIKRYEETFAVDPALLDESEQNCPPMPADDDSPGNDDFSRIIEDLDQLDHLPATQNQAKSRTEVEQVLLDISRLLETLASHQYIRNATIPASGVSALTPISPTPITASKIRKPDEPSEEEVSIYDDLRREIAYLILKLPPYAVAKLNGEQLEDLGVSKLITFQTKDTKGVMDEDQVTRQAKLTALATASSIAALARPNSSAGQHYSATASRTPAIGQAANTRYGQQYGTRTPATAPQYQRQSSNPHSYGTPTATAPRPAYAQPNQWTRAGASSGYGQPSTQQYNQRPQQPLGNYGGYGQYLQSQQAQAQQRYQSLAQQYPPQRGTAPQVAAGSAGGYQTNAAFNRTASPAAKGFPAVSMAPTPQHRPLYQAQPQPQQLPGSGRATPNNYPSQPHTPVNGFQPPPRHPQGIAPRPTSSTPQPPPTQGPTALRTNGTSLAQAQGGTWQYGGSENTASIPNDASMPIKWRPVRTLKKA